MSSNQNLSKEEIEKLFKFVRGKYVHSKDVQHEVVDHLASAIEELQSVDQSLDFDSALNEVYGRFPITGFSNLVEEKAKHMTKYWRKKIWNCYLNFFKLPRIIATLAIASLYYFILSVANPYGAMISLVLATIIYFIIIYLGRVDRKKFMSLSADYLVVAGYTTSTYLLSGFLIGIWTSTIFKFMEHGFTLAASEVSLSIGSNIGVALIFACFTVFWYATVFVFPQLLREEIEKNYGHIDELKVA